MAFDAFVSYSHAADGRLAPALQRAMQRLAKPWYRLRALRVFRDESALSANPHLWTSIAAALDGSNWFVLLASPEAAASEWVGRELAHWLEAQPPERVMVVLTDGTFEWNGSMLSGTAVPAALRGAFSEEPRHIDMRWARSETDLDMRNARFRDAVADLAAPMHGIAKDDLESEDVRLYRHARRLARGGVSVLALLVVISLVFGMIAVGERNRANHNAAVSKRNAALAIESAAAAISGALASDAARLTADNQVDTALLLGVESYQFAVHAHPGASPPGVQAAAPLLGTLDAHPSVTGFLQGLPATPQLVTYSSDGALVAAASDSGDIRVWNARTRRLQRRQPTPVGTGISSLSINREQVLVSATSVSGTVRLWDLRTNRPLQWQPPHPSGTPGSTFGAWYVPTATLSDSGVLAVVSAKRTGSSALFNLDLWNIHTGRHIAGLVALPGLAVSGAFSRDGRQLAVGVMPTNSTVALQLFDSNTGQLLRTLPGQHGNFSPVSEPFVAFGFSPNARQVTMVVSGTSDGAVATWDLTTGVATTFGSPGPGRTVVGASRDGHQLITADPSTGAASLIDATTGKRVVADFALPDLDPLAVNEPAAFDPTNHTLAIATPDNAIELLHPDPSAITTTLTRLKTLPSLGDTGAVWDALSSSGRYAARLLGVGRGPGNASYGFRSGEDNEGKAVLVASETPQTHVEILDNTTDMPTTSQPSFAAFSYAFGADDSLAISTPDGIVIWDVLHGRVLRRINDAPSRCTNSGQISYEGTATSGRVVLDCLDNIAVWALDTATTPRLQWQQKSGHSTHAPIVLSANGSTLAIAANDPSNHDVVLRDVDTGRRISSIPSRPSRGDGLFSPRDVTPIAFSHDGRSLAVGQAAGAISLYDTHSGSLRNTLPPGLPGSSQSAPTKIAFTADDATVVALTNSVVLLAWDTKSGTLITKLNSRLASDSPTFNEELNFTPDGNTLNLLAIDNTGVSTERVITWHFRVPDWVTQACALAGRNLTRREWAAYLGSGQPYQRTCPQWLPGT